ncbi:MAG: hypothetical protein O3A95_10310 [Planctomycetota bacterium]|nr:hypothetical protein [Planctomycetota bacterium]MDA1114676.1 hypothetical protein [Planctomycetota bacterium]
METFATESIADQEAFVRAHKEIANAQGVSLVCYEGGQHFTSLNAAKNDETLTDLLMQANGDVSMGLGGLLNIKISQQRVLPSSKR